MRWGVSKNRAEAAPGDVPVEGWTPGFAPVERFIREVIPTIPGGRQLSTDSRGHVELIREAAAARGLTVTMIGKKTCFYDGKLAVGGMSGWVPSLVGQHAWSICRYKDLSKQMFEAAGVPTPAGITVNPDQFDEALAHVRAAGRPMVLKPVDGGSGDGITCGITGEEQLRAAWEKIKREAKENPRYVLEEQAEGVDIRAYVVGRRVVAAATRVHAHVVGDGRQSIAELVEEKQEWRRDHTILDNRSFIVETALLQRHGRTMQDVPAADEIVVLNSVANLHVGGENVNITDLAHPDLLNLAVEATRSIPGLGVAGIDMLAPDIGTAEGAVVLEANVGANSRVHNCPTYGQPRNVAPAIIDEMIATATRT